MSLSYNEAIEARQDAEKTINNANIMLRGTARLLCGRLKSTKISGSVLRELKRELSNYNMNTGEWK